MAAPEQVPNRNRSGGGLVRPRGWIRRTDRDDITQGRAQADRARIAKELTRLVPKVSATGCRASRDLATVFAGREQKAAGLDGFDPSTPAHEALMDLLESLGSDGVIDELRQTWGDAATRAA